MTYSDWSNVAALQSFPGGDPNLYSVCYLAVIDSAQEDNCKLKWECSITLTGLVSTLLTTLFMGFLAGRSSRCPFRCIHVMAKWI